MLSARDRRPLASCNASRAAIVCNEMPHYHNRIVKDRSESVSTLLLFSPDWEALILLKAAGLVKSYDLFFEARFTRGR
jgi:hypothetical protein